MSFLASVSQGGYSDKCPESFVCTCTDIEDTHHNRVYSKQRNIRLASCLPLSPDFGTEDGATLHSAN